MTTKKKSVRKIALPHLAARKDGVLLVPLNLHIPNRLLQQIRASAGYWNSGNINEWIISSLQESARGDLEDLHAELAEKCEKGEA